MSSSMFANVKEPYTSKVRTPLENVGIPNPYSADVMDFALKTLSLKLARAQF